MAKMNPIHALGAAAIIFAGGAWAIHEITSKSLSEKSWEDLNSRDIFDKFGLISDSDLEEYVYNHNRQYYPYRLDDEENFSNNPKLGDLIFRRTPSKFEIPPEIDSKHPGHAITLKDSAELERLKDITDPSERIEALIRLVPCTTKEEHFPTSLIEEAQNGDYTSSEIWHELIGESSQVLLKLDGLLCYYYEYIRNSTYPNIQSEIENEYQKIDSLRKEYYSQDYFPLLMELYSRCSPRYLVFEELAQKDKEFDSKKANEMGYFKCFYWAITILDNVLALNGNKDMSPVVVGADGRYYINGDPDQLIREGSLIKWFSENSENKGWDNLTGQDYDTLLESIDNKIVLVWEGEGNSGHFYLIRKYEDDNFAPCLMRADFNGTVPYGDHFIPIDRESYEQNQKFGATHMFACNIV